METKAADRRRKVNPVRVGSVIIGAPNPVVVQSMTTTPTLDTEASVAQTIAIANSGAQLVRLTAQGVNHAANLANIKRVLRDKGCNVPLVADIHFNPAAAFEAAKNVEKVRINPGNFADPGRTFRKMEFTDEEYAAELERIREKFVPFLDDCRRNNTAIRIGVNHGSLSDRIMSRLGDGAEGMVESALEYLRICRDENFENVVVSIKASDVPVMVKTVRLLVNRMDAEGLYYPLHLGVTEAGNDLEARVKSAVGIGSLLSDGIGDTIRVSLCEPPENEAPVAEMIIEHSMENLAKAPKIDRSTLNFCRKTPSVEVENVAIGGNNAVAIVGTDVSLVAIENNPAIRVVRASGPFVEEVEGDDRPTAVIMSYPDIKDKDRLVVAAATDLGALLLKGWQDAIGLETEILTPEETANLLKQIVQACGLNRFQAEIVACPGCGRTLYSLSEVLETIKDECLHLKHLKIAVMGCIVNGPGEMAGADYGYVGAGHGTISLYRGMECVRKCIPQEEALDCLIDLIKSDGQWIEPQK